jgi:hypothetical protein
VAPAAHQARGQVLELGELDLQLAFARLRTLGEDLEDQAGAVHDPALHLLFHVPLLGGRQRVVEDDEGGVELVGGARDLAHLAGAGVELRVGTLAPAADHAMAAHPGALHQAHHFFDAFFIAVVAEIQADDDGGLRVSSLAGAVLQNYSASFSAPRLIGRDGTTVEMACLYTIWVTELRSSTTYWSNDSIWPCSLMPLTR